MAGTFLLPRIGSTTPTSIVYIEESTGHLFRVAPDGQSNQQLTNSSLPGIAHTWWGIYKNTLTLITQYLNPKEELETWRGIYKLGATEPTELIGRVIPNVAALGMAVSPKRDRFFYLTNTATGVSGTITDLATGKTKTIFTSPLKYWQANWPAPAIITLAPRGAASLPGALYFLNPDTGVLTRVLDGMLGLTALVNPAGTKILYNSGLGELKLYSVRDGSTRSLTIATLPEKCVWAADAVTVYCAVPNLPPARPAVGQGAQYPDDWWSGEVTFNDNFWRVNTDTGEAKVIWSGGAGIGNTNNQFDAVNLILDEIDQRLIFTDRWSATLWSLDLR